MLWACYQTLAEALGSEKRKPNDNVEDSDAESDTEASFFKEKKRLMASSNKVKLPQPTSIRRRIQVLVQTPKVSTIDFGDSQTTSSSGSLLDRGSSQHSSSRSSGKSYRTPNEN